MPRHRHPSPFLTLALACAPLLALAQVTPTVPAYPTPSDPHVGEHVGISAWSEACAPLFDRRQVPQLRQTAFTQGEHSPVHDQYEYELTYKMFVPDFCFSPGPPGGFGGDIIDVGVLPQGYHRFEVKREIEEGETLVQYALEFYMGLTDSLRYDVSGAWYAPEQSGRGVSVIYGGEVTTVYWATHDADGNPAWVLMTDVPEENTERNVIEGAAVYTHGDPLASGAATLDAEPWGDVRFTYQRCGRSRLEWDALDPAIGAGSLDMVQALLPRGIEACDVEKHASVVAERIED